jgi:putative endonuclease
MYVVLMKIKCMLFYVYIIRSEKDGRFYVGITEHIERRLKEHNSGKTTSTKSYVPWILFFTESFETRIEARAREVYLKSGIGKEFIKRKWASR